MKPISRRSVLTNTSWLGTTFTVGLAAATVTGAPGQLTPRKSNLKVVVTGGNPGDPEWK